MKNLEKYKIFILGGVLVVGLIALSFTYVFGTYTVIFDAQGGSDVAVMEVKKNDLIEKPDDPVKVGYTFEGWYLDEKEFSFDSKVTKDITLVAKWKKI